MGAVLETYEKLIGQMLKQLPTTSPQTAEIKGPADSAITPAAGTASDAEIGASGDLGKQLSYVLKKVEDLKNKRYQEQEKLLQGLQALRHIQVERHRLPLRERTKVHMFDYWPSDLVEVIQYWACGDLYVG